MIKAIKNSFRQPKGLFGYIAGKIMARENRTLNQWGIRKLKIKPGSRVLEVGYGPGYSIKYMMDHFKNLKVDGLDISETMKEQAEHEVHQEIEAGHVHLSVGDISEATLIEEHYHRVLTVNNYTIWDNRKEGLCRLFDALIPGGRIAIVMQPREEDAGPEKTRDYSRDIHEDLKTCGFTRIQSHFRKIKPELAVCVTAIKP
jgi:cyclopropane fatty-acyl-phospholipid synthase-like methyltransferase